MSFHEVERGSSSTGSCFPTDFQSPVPGKTVMSKSRVERRRTKRATPKSHAEESGQEAPGEKSHVKESCREAPGEKESRQRVVPGGAKGKESCERVVFLRPRVAKTMLHDPGVHTYISSVSALLRRFPATCKRGACDCWCKLPSLAQSYADPSPCQQLDRSWCATSPASTRQQSRNQLAFSHPFLLFHATKVE